MTPTDHQHGGRSYHDGVADAADHDRLHNDDVAHEHSDVNVRTLLLFAAGLAVVAMICAAIVYGLFNVFEAQAAANDPAVSPLAAPANQVPPRPSILDNEHEQQVLKDFRAGEAGTLDGYGWVDQKAGVARIPIEEAKKLLLERGLPTRAGAARPLEGTHAPVYGEANGGRLVGKQIQ